MQWLQVSKKTNLDNLKNERQEANGHFRNKKREYLKTRIYEL
jgi:hypothetical protein